MTTEAKQRPWEWECPYPVKLCLDSGAFGAWTRNQVLDLSEYIDYVKANQEFLWSYVNLDTIPGQVYVPRTRHDINESVKKSHENQHIMRRAGLRPIPVFHQGESFEWLYRMIEEEEDYVGISPADDLSRPAQMAWLDQCFTLITDAEGYPCVRTHGFGVLNQEFLMRYPFYTADGTTWALSSGYGSIIVPSWRKDKWDFTKVMKLSVSGLRDANVEYAGLSEHEKEVVQRYCAEFFDCSVEEMQYSTDLRRRTYLVFYHNLPKQLGVVRFKFRTSSFTQPQFPSLPPSVHGMIVQPIMATMTDATRSRALRAEDYRERLLSYYNMREMQPDAVSEYVTTGGPDGTGKSPKTNWYSAAYQSHRAMALIKRQKDGARTNGLVREDDIGGTGTGEDGLRSGDGTVLVHRTRGTGVQRPSIRPDPMSDTMGGRRPKTSRRPATRVAGT